MPGLPSFSDASPESMHYLADSQDAEQCPASANPVGSNDPNATSATFMAASRMDCKQSVPGRALET